MANLREHKNKPLLTPLVASKMTQRMAYVISNSYTNG
nr:MAG TPA: hypothetical protein [Caudoviricetes sp.]